ncbi:MAG: D-cysteine desulfhydrase family protein [Bacillota bacterium]
MLISELPRRKLATLPTPLEFLPRFTDNLGGPEIWIKRDDLTALGLGGNKARKLEFLVGDALASGCDALITTGGVQSNHARMTAAAAATVGMKCTLVLTGEEPAFAAGNLFLDLLFGAETVFCGDSEAEETMESVAGQMRQEGLNPYIIPLGGSVPVGTVGYILGGLELLNQVVETGLDFHRLFVASGSAGTTAGLAMALSTMQAPVRLHSISVSRNADELFEMTADLIHETAEFLGWNVGDTLDRLIVHDEYVGAGYAIPTREGVGAIRTLALEEAIVTDPTYTGKALAGMVDMIEDGEIAPDERVIFLHTGGFPANFAHPEVLLDRIGE